MVKLIDCEECKSLGRLPNWETPGGPELPCPWCSGSGRVPAVWVVKAHCASGWVEPVGVYESLDEALQNGRKELAGSPLTDCGTGGVRWVEVFGPEIVESLGLERTPDGGVTQTGG